MSEPQNDAKKAPGESRNSPLQWGEGLKRCAGTLADDSEWDSIMEEIHQLRKLERRSLPEEFDHDS